MTTVIIHPEPPQDMKSLILELLALADKRSDVEYVMWPEPGLRVPEELFDKFATARTKTAKVKDVAVDVPADVVEDVKVTEPVRRKPGRPKKIQEGQ